MNDFDLDESTRESSTFDDKVAPWKMQKRSVVIAGHRTSVSLENAFWEELKAIAASNGNTVNQIVTEIDGQRSGNLSSAIRLYILNALRA